MFIIKHFLLLHFLCKFLPIHLRGYYLLLFPLPHKYLYLYHLLSCSVNSHINDWFPNQNLFSTKPRILFFTVIFIIPWMLVIIYTYFSTGGVLSTAEILKIIPGIILLIPFLTVKRLENSKFYYLPAKHFSMVDILLIAFFITSSVILIMVMKQGITIS